MAPSFELDRSQSQAAPDFAPAVPAPIDVPRANGTAASLQAVLQNLTDEARSMIGAHHAVTRVAVDANWAQVLSAISLSDKYAAWKTIDAPCSGFGIDSLLCPVARPTRFTHDEVLAHPAWKDMRQSARNRPPLRGWLAVPLLNRRGLNFGMIEVTDKEGGDFDAGDELRLVRFAKITALAVENAWLYQAAHAHPAQLSIPGSAWHRGVPDVNGGTMSLPSGVTLQAEIARLLTRDGDAAAALQGCAETVARRTGAAIVRIWVAGAGAMKLQACAGQVAPCDDGRAHIPVGQFTIGHIARTRQPLLVDSILEHPHVHDKEWSRREGLTSFAGWPLLVDGELQGVLALFDRKPLPAPTFLALIGASPDIALAIKRQRVDHSGAPADADRGAEHAIIVSAVDGTIIDWNRGAEKLFGYPREQALAPGFGGLAVLVPPERAHEHHAMLHRALRGESVSCAETARRHKSGCCLDVRLTVSSLRDAAGACTGLVTVAHDLADVKRLQQQYCLAQKMEIYGQLAGGIAHDFNNLLTVILGYSEIVLGRLPTGDPQRDLVSEINKAGQRGENLTRQLLAFSRKKVIEPRVLDLNAAVADSEKMLRRLIGEDILMTTVFAPRLKPITIDPGHVQQIVLNLAVNARDAMPEGGRLTIETDNVTLDEAYAFSHPHVQPGDYVLFAMSDTGLGMSPAIRARIFEPLFTTKGPGKGTGLGLTTVQSIVTQYGGHIEVYSEVGRGTTFKVYLPQAEEAMSLTQSNAKLRTIPKGTETVLFVEDEDSVRSLGRHVLELSGYQVLDAGDGEEALQVAQAHSGAIDLLVTDVVMPHLGGRPLADRLLADRPKLKVLFVSGYTNEAVVRHGVLDSDYAFLQKPFTTAALAQKVREVLDQAARSA